MHIIVLATDEESKLRPVTDTIPTPLVPIVNRPVIGVALEIVARTGIKNVTVSLCNRSGAIATYLGEGGRWGLKIRYAVQREPLGTAGAIRWAAEHLNETVLVLPGDSVLDLDIEAAVAYHHASGSPATVILHEPHDTPADQSVWIDVDSKVLHSGGQRLCHTGAYILEPQAIRLIPANTHYDAYSQFIPALAEAGMARGYVAREYWNHLRTLSAYQEAQRVFLHSAYTPAPPAEGEHGPDLPRVRFPSIEGNQIAPGIWIGRNHVIHPSARLAAPICIGADCQIGYGVELGPEVVIGSHVVIDEEATIARSAILDATYVGRLVNIEDRVVNQTMMVDTYSGHATHVVDAFLLGALALEGRSDRLRRIASFVTVLPLLLFALPALLIIAVAVLITSGQWCIVKQERVGRRPLSRQRTPTHADTFKMLGFRTRRSDHTFTLLGRWLEAMELNHLPALWNVLCGDLNLIGIKPLLTFEAALATEEWQQRRNESPAGLVGLWFVEESCDGNLDAILITDAYYEATRSWRSDLRLLMQVPRAWLRHTRRPVEEKQIVLSTMREHSI